MYDEVVVQPRLQTTWTMGELPRELDLLRAMGAALSARYRTALPRVSANLYRDGRDSVAWHGDRVARDLPDAVVACVSLGHRRPFRLRPRGGGASLVLEPGRGDLVVMGGTCQRTWQHAVPKVRDAGPRICVMFREAYTDADLRRAEANRRARRARPPDGAERQPSAAWLPSAATPIPRGTHGRRQDQRADRPRGDARDARAALRGARRRGRDHARLHLLRPAAADRRLRPLLRGHQVGVRGGLPGLDGVAASSSRATPSPTRASAPPRRAASCSASRWSWARARADPGPRAGWRSRSAAARSAAGRWPAGSAARRLEHVDVARHGGLEVDPLPLRAARSTGSSSALNGAVARCGTSSEQHRRAGGRGTRPRAAGPSRSAAATSAPSTSSWWVFTTSAHRPPGLRVDLEGDGEEHLPFERVGAEVGDPVGQDRPQHPEQVVVLLGAAQHGDGELVAHACGRRAPTRARTGRPCRRSTGTPTPSAMPASRAITLMLPAEKPRAPNSRIAACRMRSRLVGSRFAQVVVGTRSPSRGCTRRTMPRADPRDGTLDWAGRSAGGEPRPPPAALSQLPPRPRSAGAVPSRTAAGRRRRRRARR